MNIPAGGSFHRVEKLGVIVPPLDKSKRPVIDGLEAEFQPDLTVFSVSFKQFKNFIRYTVGTGSDRKADDFLLGQGFVIEGFQFRVRPVSVCEGLEVGDELPGLPMFPVV